MTANIKPKSKATRTLRNEFGVYGYIRELEKQMSISHSIVIPTAIKDMIVQYFVWHTFEIYSCHEGLLKLNDEDLNVLQIFENPATVRFGDYISCPDFSQAHSHLSDNVEKLRKVYLMSTVVQERESNSDFNFNDVRFTGVSQCSSISIFPIFRVAFLIGINSYYCGIGFATRKFVNWEGTNLGSNGSCFLFGDGLLRTSLVFDGLKQANHQNNGTVDKMSYFCKEGDIVICEIDMNARIGRIFNEKGGESLIIGLPENEDICIILYLAYLGGMVSVLDARFV